MCLVSDMSWRKPKIVVTGPEGEDEEMANIIRSSQRQMVPEVRASVRERVSSLRPEGLPLPGKTTQGFKGSQRSLSRESAKPKSFKTVRNFWRRMEGENEDTAPPRRPRAVKKPLEPRRSQTSDKPRASWLKLPVLRRTPNARESARRESRRRSPSAEGRRSVQAEEVKKSSVSWHPSKRSSFKSEENRKSSIRPSRKTSLKSFKIPNARKSTGRESRRRSPSAEERRSVQAEEVTKSSRSWFPSKRSSIISRDPSKRSSFGSEEIRKSSIRSSRKLSLSPPNVSEISRASRKTSILQKGSQIEGQASQQYLRESLPSTSRQFERSQEPPPIDFERKSVSMKRESIDSNFPERTSLASARRSSRRSTKRTSLKQVEEDQEETADEGDEGDIDRGDEGEQVYEEEQVEGEEADGKEEADEREEEYEESKFDEEMEEEEEEKGSPIGKLSDAAVSPPTAGLRPSSLWAQLPRMFSDESLNRPSVILPVLLEEEKLFHELVAGGDVEAVSDFLYKRPKFNINCENYQGTSALHIAVKDDNEDMVQYLLSLPGIEVRDSHLYAIRDNHPTILIMILDKLQTINSALEFMACSNSPEFAENITPLILAAEAGHFEIVGLLISRGHVIPRPHKPRCFCKEECQAIMKSQDVLSISSGKLHIYRALSNPAYICQTNPDPLLVAFKLSKELITCGHVDTIYLRQYEALAESLRTFAVEIIAECRTLEEVETVLSESKDCNLKGYWRYPRLTLAMDYKQKEFIAHPNVQQVLERTWAGDWIAWRGYRVYTKALYVFPRLLTLPLVLAVLMITPTSKWAKHFSLPVNKLLSNVASYLIFLLLVFIQSNVDKKNQTRDTKPTGVEIFLVIYVLTFMYNSIRSLLRQGFYRYFSFMWNLYELLMELFFIMAFVFLIAAEIKTTIKGDKDLERKYWYYLDPELISEGFFVLASVMAFLKILLLFQISYRLGPLQVSLGKMTNDCAMFSIIFAIIILAFTAGLCKFYSYYEDMVQTNPETGEIESTQVNSFTGVMDTFKTLFWGLFGMSSFDVADVVIDNVEDDESSNGTVTNEHHFTEAVGYFAFATYMILTVIVILNMLIATMSNTFQKVTDNVDIEWLFGRTEVYMSYIDLPVLPPPFNVIPTTHALVNLVKGQKAKGGKLMGDIEKGTVEEQENRLNMASDDYYVLMSQLVQRYFSTKNSEND